MIASAVTSLSPHCAETPASVDNTEKEVTPMPTNREFTVHLEDRPGTLGRVCHALADYKVNIVAFQAARAEGRSLVRFVVDNPGTAKKAFDNEGVEYQETEVAQIKRPSRSGELARAAARLGEADINIDYAYCGVDPSANTPVIIFGVAEAGQAAVILDRNAAAA
jgi:hypothetical protein